MKETYRISQLQIAKTERKIARNAMNAAKPRTPKWRESEQDLIFWQNKVAFLESIGKQA